MEIEVKIGDLFDEEADAVVHPTNSMLEFSTGLALSLSERAGDGVERELEGLAPIAVGAAIITKGGDLKAKWIIHVPVVDEPTQRGRAEDVRRAARAALLAAQRRGFESLVMPGYAGERNAIPVDQMTRAIADELRAHKQPKPARIVLIDLDAVVVENFRLMIESTHDNRKYPHGARR